MFWGGKPKKTQTAEGGGSAPPAPRPVIPAPGEAVPAPTSTSTTVVSGDKTLNTGIGPHTPKLIREKISLEWEDPSSPLQSQVALPSGPTSTLPPSIASSTASSVSASSSSRTPSTSTNQALTYAFKAALEKREAGFESLMVTGASKAASATAKRHAGHLALIVNATDTVPPWRLTRMLRRHAYAVRALPSMTYDPTTAEFNATSAASFIGGRGVNYSTSSRSKKKQQQVNLDTQVTEADVRKALADLRQAFASAGSRESSIVFVFSGRAAVPKSGLVPLAPRLCFHDYNPLTLAGSLTIEELLTTLLGTGAAVTLILDLHTLPGPQANEAADAVAAAGQILARLNSAPINPQLELLAYANKASTVSDSKLIDHVWTLLHRQETFLRVPKDERDDAHAIATSHQANATDVAAKDLDEQFVDKFLDETKNLEKTPLPPHLYPSSDKGRNFRHPRHQYSTGYQRPARSSMRSNASVRSGNSSTGPGDSPSLGISTASVQAASGWDSDQYHDRSSSSRGTSSEEEEFYTGSSTSMSNSIRRAWTKRSQIAHRREATNSEGSKSGYGTFDISSSPGSSISTLQSIAYALSEPQLRMGGAIYRILGDKSLEIDHARAFSVMPTAANKLCSGTSWRFSSISPALIGAIEGAFKGAALPWQVVFLCGEDDGGMHVAASLYAAHSDTYDNIQSCRPTGIDDRILFADLAAAAVKRDTIIMVDAFSLATGYALDDDNGPFHNIRAVVMDLVMACMRARTTELAHAAQQVQGLAGPPTAAPHLLHIIVNSRLDPFPPGPSITGTLSGAPHFSIMRQAARSFLPPLHTDVIHSLVPEDTFVNGALRWCAPPKDGYAQIGERSFDAGSPQHLEKLSSHDQNSAIRAAVAGMLAWCSIGPEATDKGATFIDQLFIKRSETTSGEATYYVPKTKDLPSLWLQDCTSVRLATSLTFVMSVSKVSRLEWPARHYHRTFLSWLLNESGRTLGRAAETVLHQFAWGIPPSVSVPGWFFGFDSDSALQGSWGLGLILSETHGTGRYWFMPLDCVEAVQAALVDRYVLNVSRKPKSTRSDNSANSTRAAGGDNSKARANSEALTAGGYGSGAARRRHSVMHTFTSVNKALSAHDLSPIVDPNKFYIKPQDARLGAPVLETMFQFMESDPGSWAAVTAPSHPMPPVVQHTTPGDLPFPPLDVNTSSGARTFAAATVAHCYALGVATAGAPDPLAAAERWIGIAEEALHPQETSQFVSDALDQAKRVVKKFQSQGRTGQSGIEMDAATGFGLPQLPSFGGLSTMRALSHLEGASEDLKTTVERERRLVDEVNSGLTIHSKGDVPVVLVHGPTGSGKTACMEQWWNQVDPDSRTGIMWLRKGGKESLQGALARRLSLAYGHSPGRDEDPVLAMDSVSTTLLCLCRRYRLHTLVVDGVHVGGSETDLSELVGAPKGEKEIAETAREIAGLAMGLARLPKARIVLGLDVDSIVAAKLVELVQSHTPGVIVTAVSAEPMPDTPQGFQDAQALFQSTLAEKMLDASYQWKQEQKDLADDDPIRTIDLARKVYGQAETGLRAAHEALFAAEHLRSEVDDYMSEHKPWTHLGISAVDARTTYVAAKKAVAAAMSARTAVKSAPSAANLDINVIDHAVESTGKVVSTVIGTLDVLDKFNQNLEPGLLGEVRSTVQDFVVICQRAVGAMTHLATGPAKAWADLVMDDLGAVAADRWKAVRQLGKRGVSPHVSYMDAMFQRLWLDPSEVVPLATNHLSGDDVSHDGTQSTSRSVSSTNVPPGGVRARLAKTYRQTAALLAYEMFYTDRDGGHPFVVSTLHSPRWMCRTEDLDLAEGTRVAGPLLEALSSICSRLFVYKGRLFYTPASRDGEEEGVGTEAYARDYVYVLDLAAVWRAGELSESSVEDVNWSLFQASFTANGGEEVTIPWTEGEFKTRLQFYMSLLVSLGLLHRVEVAPLGRLQATSARGARLAIAPLDREMAVDHIAARRLGRDPFLYALRQLLEWIKSETPGMFAASTYAPVDGLRSFYEPTAALLESMYANLWSPHAFSQGGDVGASVSSNVKWRALVWAYSDRVEESSRFTASRPHLRGSAVVGEAGRPTSEHWTTLDSVGLDQLRWLSEQWETNARLAQGSILWSGLWRPVNPDTFSVRARWLAELHSELQARGWSSREAPVFTRIEESTAVVDRVSARLEMIKSNLLQAIRLSLSSLSSELKLAMASASQSMVRSNTRPLFDKALQERFLDSGTSGQLYNAATWDRITRCQQMNGVNPEVNGAQEMPKLLQAMAEDVMTRVAELNVAMWDGVKVIVADVARFVNEAAMKADQGRSPGREPQLPLSRVASAAVQAGSVLMRDLQFSLSGPMFDLALVLSESIHLGSRNGLTKTLSRTGDSANLKGAAEAVLHWVHATMLVVSALTESATQEYKLSRYLHGFYKIRRAAASLREVLDVLSPDGGKETEMFANGRDSTSSAGDRRGARGVGGRSMRSARSHLSHLSQSTSRSGTSVSPLPAPGSEIWDRIMHELLEGGTRPRIDVARLHRQFSYIAVLDGVYESAAMSVHGGLVTAGRVDPVIWGWTRSGEMEKRKFGRAKVTDSSPGAKSVYRIRLDPWHSDEVVVNDSLKLRHVLESKDVRSERRGKRVAVVGQLLRDFKTSPLTPKLSDSSLYGGLSSGEVYRIDSERYVLMRRVLVEEIGKVESRNGGTTNGSRRLASLNQVLGVMTMGSGPDPKEALVFFTRALTYLQQKHDFYGTAAVLTNMGIVQVIAAQRSLLIARAHSPLRRVETARASLFAARQLFERADEVARRMTEYYGPRVSMAGLYAKTGMLGNDLRSTVMNEIGAVEMVQYGRTGNAEYLEQAAESFLESVRFGHSCYSRPILRVLFEKEGLGAETREAWLKVSDFWTGGKPQLAHGQGIEEGDVDLGDAVEHTLVGYSVYNYLQARSVAVRHLVLEAVIDLDRRGDPEAPGQLPSGVAARLANAVSEAYQLVAVMQRVLSRRTGFVKDLLVVRGVGQEIADRVNPLRAGRGTVNEPEVVEGADSLWCHLNWLHQSLSTAFSGLGSTLKRYGLVVGASGVSGRLVGLQDRSNGGVAEAVFKDSLVRQMRERSWELREEAVRFLYHRAASMLD